MGRRKRPSILFGLSIPVNDNDRPNDGFGREFSTPGGKKTPFGPKPGSPIVRSAEAIEKVRETNESARRPIPSTRECLMQNAERKKVIETMSYEPRHPIAMPLTCAACLVLLALFAIIGTSSSYESEKSAARQTGQSASSIGPVRIARAEAHRKQTFDQRRTHLLGSQRQSTVAGLAPVGATAAPAP